MITEKPHMSDLKMSACFGTPCISDHLDRCPQPPKKPFFEETNISTIISMDMKQCSIRIWQQFSVYLSLFFIAITLRRLKCSSYLSSAAHLPSFWYVCEGVGDYEINCFKWFIDRQKFVIMNLVDSIYKIWAEIW